ncbi:MULTISPECIES: hypothetical protein [unclassified Cupriavidus]|uniref:hypothetical protein n=1 Tax=Cupriavidus sp. H19C3 TaxID=3241603 RepID=UPI003BF913EF
MSFRQILIRPLVPGRSRLSPRPLALLPALLAVAACKPAAPTADTFAAVMRQHIDSHAELCLGRHAWPLDVPDVPEKDTLRDYVQMAALEHAGIVAHDTGFQTERPLRAGGTETVPAWRYRLTEQGRKYFKARPDTANAHAEGQPDLCYGTVHLQDIKRWTPIQMDTDSRRNLTTVTYTYTIDAAPWTHDPAVQKAFPVVARVVNGGGKDELRQDMVQTDNGWKVR